MKKRILVMLFLLLSVQVYAEELQDIQQFYDAEIFNINYSFWGGLSLEYQNDNYRIQFGLSSNISEILKKDKEARLFIDLYEKQNIGGNIALWGGFGIYIASVIFVPLLNNDDDSSSYYDDSLDVSTITSLLGSALMTTGLVLIPLSKASLVDGVNVYNRNKMGSYN